MTKSSRSIWHYVVSVKTTVKISSIFVAFLENTNFIKKILALVHTYCCINLQYVSCIRRMTVCRFWAYHCVLTFIKKTQDMSKCYWWLSMFGRYSTSKSNGWLIPFEIFPKSWIISKYISQYIVTKFAKANSI